jgi:hypothetical protein
MSAQPNFRSSQTGAANEEASIGTLLKELAHEVPSMLRNEVALAKSEARESLRATKEGVAALSTGGAVMTAGLVVLLFAAVYALSNAVSPWLAALIVGGVTVFVGYMLIQSGRRKLQGDSMKPTHTINSLKKDSDVIRRRPQ